MPLVEDMLSETELAEIESILDGNDIRFDTLVSLTSLSPSEDFQHSDLRSLNLCNADLRGFDFTGSDLRGCVRNSNTVIDDTTVLSKSKIDWIEEEALPIIEKMQKIEIAASSQIRRDLLENMVGQFGWTPHVVQYTVSAALRSRSFDAFLDFASFIPVSAVNAYGLKLKTSATSLFRKKVSQSRSRTGRTQTAVFATDLIMQKLEGQSGTLSALIYGYIAEAVSRKQQTKILRGMATVEPADIATALEKIGKE